MGELQRPGFSRVGMSYPGVEFNLVFEDLGTDMQCFMCEVRKMGIACWGPRWGRCGARTRPDCRNREGLGTGTDPKGVGPKAEVPSSGKALLWKPCSLGSPPICLPEAAAKTKKENNSIGRR